MNTLVNAFVKFVEVVLVVLMAGMALMVLLNVILRYGFNSGLMMSEEMSRFFFIWLTFIGAVLALKENAHMGVESLVRLFGRRGRVICMAITNMLILLCVGVLFWGTWLQAPINASMKSPVAGMPMILVYGVAFFTAAGMGIIAFYRLLMIVTGRVTDAEIAHFVGEYESVEELVGRGE